METQMENIWTAVAYLIAAFVTLVVGNAIIAWLIWSAISQTIEVALAGFSGAPVSTGQGTSPPIIGVVIVSVITYGLAGYFFVKALYVTLTSHAEY